MISRILALAAALALAATPAFAANQLPTIAGPNGQVTADPVVIIGYDSGTGLPCVIGKTVTCVLSAGGGGGGGGAVTVADGADVAEGAKADAACASDASNTCSQISMEKRIAARITSMISALGSPFQAGGALGAGSALIGKVGLDQTTPGTTNAITVTGGCTPYHLSGGTAASNNSTLISSSARTLCDLTPINTTTIIYYLKIYDTSSAPTCSSATGIKHVYPIPPAAAAGQAGGIQRSITVGGEAYTSGIGYCVTAGGTDTDNSNAATGVFIEASYRNY